MAADRVRLRGKMGFVVPASVGEGGKRRGNFGFAKCDGVVEGELDPSQPSPIGLDHFIHVRETPAMAIEDLAGKTITFYPVEHPKGPRGVEVEVLS